MLIGRKIIGTVAFMGGVMSIPTPFIKSWQEMIEYNSEYFIKPTERILYTQATVSYHSFARNSLVDQMKGDWLLQLDADIIFDPDIVVRMLMKMNLHNIDVMIAPYLYKAEPNPPVMYGWNPKTKAKYMVGDWTRTADLVQIQGSGAGCLMVRRKVFNKIREKLNCSPFDIYFDKQKSPLSEDHSFFQRCQDLKIPVFFSPDITVKHLKYRELDVNRDFKPQKEQLSKRVDVKGFKVGIHIDK